MLSALVLVLGVSTAAQAQTAQRSFLHRTTPANKSGHITFVNHPSVYYDGSKWRVYFDDFRPIAGMAFNVEIL